MHAVSHRVTCWFAHAGRSRRTCLINQAEYQVQRHTSLHTFPLLFFSLLILFFCTACPAYSVQADSLESQRIIVGLDLFPSLLAADKDIAVKAGPDGRLLLLLLYDTDKSRVLDFAGRLEKIGTIRGIPIRVELVRPPISAHKKTPVAGVFVCERLPEELLDTVIQFGIHNHLIVFSPFKGDVEAGVLGGIFINDRILPYINKQTMELSGIRLKHFFIRVAKWWYENEKEAK